MLCPIVLDIVFWLAAFRYRVSISQSENRARARACVSMIRLRTYRVYRRDFPIYPWTELWRWRNRGGERPVRVTRNSRNAANSRERAFYIGTDRRDARKNNFDNSLHDVRKVRHLWRYCSWLLSDVFTISIRFRC